MALSRTLEKSEGRYFVPRIDFHERDCVIGLSHGRTSAWLAESATIAASSAFGGTPPRYPPDRDAVREPRRRPCFRDGHRTFDRSRLRIGDPDQSFLGPAQSDRPNHSHSTNVSFCSYLLREQLFTDFKPATFLGRSGATTALDCIEESLPSGRAGNSIPNLPHPQAIRPPRPVPLTSKPTIHRSYRWGFRPALEMKERRVFSRP